MSGRALADLAHAINPIVRGWIGYYSCKRHRSLVPTQLEGMAKLAVAGFGEPITLKAHLDPIEALDIDLSEPPIASSRATAVIRASVLWWGPP